MLRRHAQLLLDRQPVSERSTVTDQVRAELLRTSHVGLASIDQVAGGLAMTARTLQRRLRVEGGGFDNLSRERCGEPRAGVPRRPGIEHQRSGLLDRVLRVERVLTRVPAMGLEAARKTFGAASVDESAVAMVKRRGRMDTQCTSELRNLDRIAAQILR
jgi:hypothetical protein